MKKITAMFVALAALLSLCACAAGAGQASQEPEASRGLTWQEQYDLGVRYLSEGKYQEAILAFAAAIEIDPKRAPAYVGRGDAYVLSGETEKNLTAAKTDYEKAIELDETSPEAYLGLADVYIRRGEYEKALEILRQGLEKTGENEKIADKIQEMERGSIKDSSGQLRRTNGYDESGALAWYHTYDYDADGVRTAVTWFDGQGNQKGRVDETYDADGKMLRGFYAYSPNDGNIWIGDFQYDAEGREMRVDVHDLENNWTGYTLFENGPDGVIKLSNYDSDGVLTDYMQFEYEDGENTRITYYNRNGQITEYVVYEYDADGRVARQIYYEPDHSISRYEIYKWNEDGEMAAIEHYDADGNLTSRETYD